VHASDCAALGWIRINIIPDSRVDGQGEEVDICGVGHVFALAAHLDGLEERPGAVSRRACWIDKEVVRPLSDLHNVLFVVAEEREEHRDGALGRRFARIRRYNRVPDRIRQDLLHKGVVGCRKDHDECPETDERPPLVPEKHPERPKRSPARAVKELHPRRLLSLPFTFVEPEPLELAVHSQIMNTSEALDVVASIEISVSNVRLYANFGVGFPSYAIRIATIVIKHPMLKIVARIS
jgi:hypothetical protein